jgi:oligogalacturonide lyase
MGDIFINPDGTHKEIYLYPFTRSSHFQMNYRMDMGVADAAFIKKDMADGYSYMSLTKYSGNYVQVGLLCKHGTSWLTQNSHPHPIFTRDDKHVIFSSDFGGKRNVYMAEANWEKCIKGPAL